MAKEKKETKKETAEEPKKNKKIKKIKKGQTVRQVPKGQAYIQATYNNTIVTLTDLTGNTLSWSSAGKLGFRGPKKATPYAANIIVKDAVEKAQKYGLKEVQVFVKGVGMGREAAVRSLYTYGLEISTIKDTTPTPHNGCRPPKVRRV
ncbi:MAG: 30S ribosomal protein S11 [Patescibacteria group bacterium]|jgi:small subunit ribosomal protein S11|nr:30S ribosomal protein S11 [Patescibacteria group bacterium]